MALTFKNTDEINAFLLKDTTPHDYCISIVKEIIAHIREYLDGNRTDKDDYFDDTFFFSERQCCIYLKNHTCIFWALEVPLESVVLPDPDDIEYVTFYRSFPMAVTKEQAEALGITQYPVAKSKRCLFFDLKRMMSEDIGWKTDYKFDSIRGAYLPVDNKDGEWNPDDSYRVLTRGWRDYSVQLDDLVTYWTDSLDAYIGALIAEQILLSNQPEDRSMRYGNQEYQSRAVCVFPFSNNDEDIYSEQFMEKAYSYCCNTVHTCGFEYDGCITSPEQERRANRFALFIYYYMYSLKRFSVAENFSIIEPIIMRWLNTFYWQWEKEKEELIPAIEAVCHADYYTRPELKLETPLEHMQAAIWALTNSTSYIEAMQNILVFVNYRHSGQLAVALTGAFAGIYYQHCRIPRYYLTENRYYSRYSLHIIPLDHKVYDQYDQQMN